MGAAPSHDRPSGGEDPNAITGDPLSPEFWRRKGDAYAKARNQAFADSKAAYQRRDHQSAGIYSQAGKRLDGQSKQAHARAAELLLAANNGRRGPGEVDLHGLRVAEAVAAADAALRAARAAGRGKLVLIVGRGLHSADGVAKLKPAIEQLIRRHSLRCTPGVPNEGPPNP